jgi:hypothetical protein
MNQSDSVELPASLAAVWGMYERPTKGPRPGLSIKRIVEATIKIAVTDGLAAVSMNRVAAELGAAPMSLYRYVASKDELLALALDTALGAPSPLSNRDSSKMKRPCAFPPIPTGSIPSAGTAWRRLTSFTPGCMWIR